MRLSIIKMYRKVLETLERNRGSHTLIVTLSGVLLGALISGWRPFFSICKSGYFQWWPLPFGTCNYLSGLSFLCAFLLLLYGHQYFDGFLHMRLLNLRNRNPRVGIISDLGESMEGETASWTDTPPQEWKNRLRETADNLSYSFIAEEMKVHQDILHSYTVILNPYGGVYPENDLQDNSTLADIFNYVEEGGVFVNVADFPFFWAYSIQQRRRINPSRIEHFTQPDGRLQALQPFSAHPLVHDYGISVISIPGESDITVSHEGEEFGIVRALPDVDNIEEILPVKIEGDKVHAAARLRYGEGYFIFFLISLTQEGSNKLESLIIAEVIGTLKAVSDLFPDH